MAWTKGKTLKIFIVVVLVSFMWAAGSIFIVTHKMIDDEEGKSKDEIPENKTFWTTSFVYYLASLFGTGLGCIWFRLFHTKMKWSHGMVHIVTFALMIVSHRKMFELLFAGDIDAASDDYWISQLGTAIYFIQLILSVHMVLIGYGRSEEDKRRHIGMHSFFGIMVFFISTVDGHSGWTYIKTGDIAFVFALIYFWLTIYLILNPYFDWRIMHNMLQSKGPSKRKHGKSSRSRSKSPRRSRTPSQSNLNRPQAKQPQAKQPQAKQPQKTPRNSLRAGRKSKS